MRSYSETCVFPAAVLRALEVAQGCAVAMPDPPAGAPPLRCHEVARAVARRLRASGAFGPAWTVEVVDGRFGRADHTWVELRGPGGEWVLDPYAVGRLPQVQVLGLDRSARTAGGTSPAGCASTWTRPWLRGWRPGSARREGRRAPGGGRAA